MYRLGAKVAQVRGAGHGMGVARARRQGCAVVIDGGGGSGCAERAERAAAAFHARCCSACAALHRRHLP